jgi:hypothetical protein
MIAKCLHTTLNRRYPKSLFMSASSDGRFVVFQVRINID